MQPELSGEFEDGSFHHGEIQSRYYWRNGYGRAAVHSADSKSSVVHACRAGSQRAQRRQDLRAGDRRKMGGWADHVFKGMKPQHYGSPFVSPMVTRNVSAVTGACLAVSKATIEKIGGFDEKFIVYFSISHFNGVINIIDLIVFIYLILIPDVF